jgi:hypothetical protein
MVDASAPPLDAVLLSDLARRRGVSKQAIHKRVSALAKDGRLTLWPGPNRSVLVSEAAFDFAVGQVGDPVKEASAASAALLRGGQEIIPPAPPSAAPEVLAAPPLRQPQPVPADGDTPAYREAKARDAHYAAEIKRLAFERDSGQLYRVEEVEAALIRISDAVKEVVRGLNARADEGAEALEDGMPAFRRWLSRVGDDICRALAGQWRVMAEEAPRDRPAADRAVAEGETSEEE